MVREPAFRRKNQRCELRLRVPKRLSPREERFVSEYLLDLDACRAALAAGYSASMAHSKAFQWVSGSKSTKPHVMAAVAKAQARRAKRTEVTADAVVAELAKLGFANMADYMRAGPSGDPFLDFSSLTRDQAAALVEVTVDDYVDRRGENARDVRRVKFKLADKRAALVDLGRHLGIFRDRMELTGKDGNPLEVDLNDVRQRVAGRIARLGIGGGAGRDPEGSE
jgi:phage terminase small subunit